MGYIWGEQQHLYGWAVYGGRMGLKIRLVRQVGQDTDIIQQSQFLTP